MARVRLPPICQSSNPLDHTQRVSVSFLTRKPPNYNGPHYHGVLLGIRLRSHTSPALHAAKRVTRVPSKGLDPPLESLVFQPAASPGNAAEIGFAV